MLESELFGHERGAFTGAERARAGLFERAERGTLFLDEIGETSPDFQAKLLRVLQEKRVTRVGGSEERALDFRVVAATNRDLKREVEAGAFREDLYFRLAVIPIQLPPLRERPEDVLALARHFFVRAAADRKPPLEGWSAEVEAFLRRHPWPGNARELENTIERGVALARGPRIELDDLLLEGESAAARAPRRGGEGPLADWLDQRAAERIREVLASSGKSRAEAARRLGVDRTTLWRWMQRLGIAD